MKKRIFVFLIMLCVLFTGCSQPQSPLNEESENDTSNMTDENTQDDVLEEYLSNLDILESPVREYGDDAGFVQLDEELMVRVLYPEGELSDLNNSIVNWVENTVAYYQVEAKGSKDSGDSAELTAEYESFVLGDDIVSVKITGIFDKPYNAHPIDIIATFHASLKTGKLIELEDILLADGKEFLQKKVIEDAKIKDADIDEALLDNWTLKNDGLEIILERGKYLAMSEGTVTLKYSFDELVGIIDSSLKTETEKIPETDSEVKLPEDDDSNSASIDPTKPMIALTFDDGPSKHTERLLDMFANYGGKGTFFVVGNLIDNRQETLNRMVSEGHEIGGHSWDHRQLTKLSSEDMTNEIMNTRAKIYSLTGVDTTIMRPPYGSYNDETKRICAENGIVIINWSLDTLDWKYRDADKVYDAIMSQVKDGDIILCHDLHGSTVEAMERVIPDLIAQGYQLVTVSELLSYGDTEVNAGTVHTKR
ncbi:MAG: polysaccharide deacetylase family protein [Agathobacter sp.]|nr:polysaccharide deacetylase family protein [Agathobacter sp.]